MILPALWQTLNSRANPTTLWAYIHPFQGLSSKFIAEPLTFFRSTLRLPSRKVASSTCLTLGVHSTEAKVMVRIRSKVGKCFRMTGAITVGA